MVKQPSSSYRRDVAGMQPAAGLDGLAGAPWITIITIHHHGSAEHKLAALSRRHASRGEAVGHTVGQPVAFQEAESMRFEKQCRTVAEACGRRRQDLPDRCKHNYLPAVLLSRFPGVFPASSMACRGPGCLRLQYDIAQIPLPGVPSAAPAIRQP